MAYVRLGLDAGIEIAVAVLGKALGPDRLSHSALPAADALVHLLSSDNQLSDIIVGGDSAGRNLTMASTAHLRVPHSVAVDAKLKEPLVGPFAMSRC